MSMIRTFVKKVKKFLDLLEKLFEEFFARYLRGMTKELLFNK